MRPFDPRAWNLIPAALLFACATQAPTSIDETSDGDSTGDGDTPSDGDETGDGDGEPTGDDNTTGDGDGDGDDGGECNPPCGPHQFCSDGEYCYTIPPDPSCVNDSHCNVGKHCDYDDPWTADCKPIPPLPGCDAPELIEIPLPSEAQGFTLDLEFVDLDAAGHDELLLLRPGELLVVRSDQSVASYEISAAVDEFAAVHANDDERLDLVLTSSTAAEAQLLLNNGDGTFASPTTLSLPALLQPRAIDWVPGGAQELVAIDAGFRTVTLVSELAGVPSVLDLQSLGTSVGAIHVVSSGDLALAVRSGCGVTYFNPADLAQLGKTYPKGAQLCVSEHETGDPLFVLTASVGANTSLRPFHGFGIEAKEVIIQGPGGDLANVDGLGVVIADPTVTRLLIPDQQSFSCAANLNSLPIASWVVAGDFADNPGEEFLLLGQNQLSVWARP